MMALKVLRMNFRPPFASGAVEQVIGGGLGLQADRTSYGPNFLYMFAQVWLL
jgi:hypothetical protein